MKFHWADENSDIEEILDFFIANLDSEFISHSELQGGRAADRGHWNLRLRQVLEREMASRLLLPFDPQGRTESGHCLLMREDRRLVGLANLDFQYPADAPSYCVLEDLIVDRNIRGRGLGTQLFREVEALCARKATARLFFESGAGNHAAHRLFERLGCEIVSHYFMKELP